MKYIAGLDIGTTGCKITVYDQTGTFCKKYYQVYPVRRAMGKHEVDALDIWSSVKAVLKEAAECYPEIEGIGVTSFGESCVLLDENDIPVRPVMLYTDPRGEEECRILQEKLGEGRVERITGLAPHSTYGLPKVLWVKKNEKALFERVRHILMMEDFIIYMLTGSKKIDYSLAARSMAFDIHNLCWSKEILDAAGLENSFFSETVCAGTPVGKIVKELVEIFGFTNAPIVLPVGHDQVAAAIGAGVYDTESAVDGAGTVECVTPVFGKIPDISGMTKNNYAIVPYLKEGTYVTYAFSYTGGALIDWYTKNLAKKEHESAKRMGKTVYEVLEENMKDEPTGILVLPHFAGAATPYMDAGSKGAILGLTVEHTVNDLYRAMMEGVVYEMRLNISRLNQIGISPKKLYATGGGAASDVWMQMKADILNLPIISLESAEAGATGCAMLAGIAVGCFENLEDAKSKMIYEKKVYMPRQGKHELYSRQYEKYERLYEAVRAFM